MARSFLLGLDSGSTATKAVLFDLSGRPVGIGSHRVAQQLPQPNWVERDMDEVWQAACQAIRDALSAAGASPGEIAAIGVTGHGDGLYLLDRQGAPLGPGMLSLDSRAFSVVEDWRRQGVIDHALALTGQHPYPYAAVSLLAWIKRHQPERFAAIGHVLFCKDWLRYKLSGVIATDPTEASTSFTELYRQTYDPAVLELYGLGELAAALPTIAGSCETIGRVTEAAARETGLQAGIPVAGGLHDVTASAVGLGNLSAGALSITAGTFSINEVLSDQPRLDPRWACRAGLKPGQWMSMAISPASSSNVDWFLRETFPEELRQAAAKKIPVFDLLHDEITRAFQNDSRLIFHPFLFGSPYAAPASAGFFGLRAWHQRGHLLRAVLEGTIFNHRTHVDALASAFPIHHIGLTGGGAGNPLIGQLFADILGRTVDISDAQEAGALGAALCAGVGAGLYRSLEDAAKQACHNAGRYEPTQARHAILSESFARFTRLVEAMTPLWPDLIDDKN